MLKIFKFLSHSIISDSCQKSQKIIYFRKKLNVFQITVSEMHIFRHTFEQIRLYCVFVNIKNIFVNMFKNKMISVYHI